MPYSDFSERIFNGKPLDWNYWGNLKNITPAQAAKLANRIDPHKWPNKDCSFGKIPSDMQEKIDRLTQNLSNQKPLWSLEDLAENLKDETPEGMLDLIRTKQTTQNIPNTHTTQAVHTKQKSRGCQLHSFIWRVYQKITKKKGKATAKDVWNEIVINYKEYDSDRIIQEIPQDRDQIEWQSHYGNISTLKCRSFDSLLSRLKKKNSI